MDKLGIEPKLLLAQLVNFTIIMLVLKKYLYQPILDLLDKRKAEIAENAKVSEKLKKSEVEMNEKVDKALSKAREEALGIINDAKKTAKEVEKDMVTAAHEQAETIMTRAKKEAEEMKKSAQLELQKEAIDLAVAMAGRLLTASLTDTEQRAIIDKRIKELDDLAKKELKK